MIDEKMKNELKGIFAKELKEEVKLWLFTSKNKDICPYCKETLELINEIGSIEERVKVFHYDIDEHKSEAKVFGIDKVPAMLVHGAKAYGIYYYGIPSGYEFSSLIGDIIDVSNGKTGLSEAIKKEARAINSNVDIKVFVTPTCPYCPRAVRVAHMLAMENSNIKSSMIEATEFMEMSSKYDVMGVPKVVINDTVSFEGALPEEEFINHIKEAISKA